MQMYTYLIINLLTVIFPIALSFDKKVAFYRNFTHLLPAILVSALIFIFWDIFFTWLGVWSFNPEYITGVSFLGLPIEEIIFFFAIPYACIFIYSCIESYFPDKKIIGNPKLISWFFFLVNIALISWFHDRLYTVYTNLGLALLWLIIFITGHTRFLGRFYLAYLVSLIPFLIVNGILTAKPVVMYNDMENMGFRIFTIPLDDILYHFLLFLLNISLFEALKNRRERRKEKPEKFLPR